MEATLNALRGGRDVLQGMSNAAAGAVSVPVDVLAWALRKAGVPVGDEPVGGSDWMKRKGLTREPENRVAGVIGESIGGVLPMVASAKAPQIAAGVNQMIDNAMAPRRMNPQAGAIVWHGSPHKFTRFDSSKIGTGEGAQAYGHGIYVAESPDVARSYVSAGGAKPTATPEVYAADIVGMMGGEQKALKHLQDILPPAGKTTFGGESRDLISKAIKAVQSGTYKQNVGSIYKVDLPDEAIGRMLDWDKPLSQQSKHVVKLLKKEHPGFFQEGRYSDKLTAATDLSRNFPAPISDLLQQVDSMQGVMRYGVPAEQMKGNDLWFLAMRNAEKSPDKAAAVLRERGIPGIRYLDQGSRAAGQGTSNYVVFPGNEDLLKILEINDQPVQAVIDALRNKR